MFIASDKRKHLFARLFRYSYRGAEQMKTKRALNVIPLMKSWLVDGIFFLETFSVLSTQKRMITRWEAD